MEKQQLDALYRAYSREIYCYLYSLCHNRSQAEDLMQETFLKALLSLSDSHTNVRAWLYLVARNLFFSQYKRNQRQTDLSDDDWVSEENMLEGLIDEEQKQMLYKGIQHLNRRQREVLTLYYFSGLSQKKISHILNLSPDNVRVLVSRARKELRHYMEVHGYELS